MNLEATGIATCPVTKATTVAPRIGIQEEEVSKDKKLNKSGNTNKISYVSKKKKHNVLLNTIRLVTSG